MRLHKGLWMGPNRIKQIQEALADGHSQLEIARELQLSPSTVCNVIKEYHLKRGRHGAESFEARPDADRLAPPAV